MRYDLLLRHEAAGIVFVISGTRNTRLPARRIQREGVPAMAAPGVARLVGLLQDNMLDGVLGQVMADRKPGLAAAHNDGVYLFGHRSSPRPQERRLTAHQSVVLTRRCCRRGAAIRPSFGI
jgi:hypothetical protein